MRVYINKSSLDKPYIMNFFYGRGACLGKLPLLAGKNPSGAASVIAIHDRMGEADSKESR